jgi:flagellar basal body rod protein FlgG
MGSGKYGALTGAISRMQMLDKVNSNLANVNTDGYKKRGATFEARFSEALATRGKEAMNFASVSNEVIDFTQGVLKKTDNPMHLAISGEGFFRLQQADGEIVYARRGSFDRNQEGEMITAAGARLLGDGDAPVALPVEEYSIIRDGSIISDNQRVGSIPLYSFEDTSILQRGNDGVFVAPQDAEVAQSPQPEMLQGYLEGSNVNMMQETVRMVYTMRVFEATQKALTAYDNMDSKLAELGNLQ